MPQVIAVHRADAGKLLRPHPAPPGTGDPPDSQMREAINWRSTPIPKTGTIIEKTFFSRFSLAPASRSATMATTDTGNNAPKMTV